MDAISFIRKIDNPGVVFPENVTISDSKGNQWADDLCGKASKNEKLPMHITTPIIYNKNLILLIPNRLVAILCALPNRSKHNMVTPKSTIQHDVIHTLIEKFEHILFEDGKIYTALDAVNLFRLPVQVLSIGSGASARV